MADPLTIVDSQPLSAAPTGGGLKIVDSKPLSTDDGSHPPTLADRFGVKNGFLRATLDTLEGANNSLNRTVYGIGDMAAGALGLSKPTSNPQVKAATITPNSLAGKAGEVTEKAAEYMVPEAKVAKLANVIKAGLGTRITLTGAANAATAYLQTQGDPTATVTAGLTGAAIPAVVAGVQKAAGAVAPAIYRSALKPRPGGPKTSLADIKDMVDTGLQREIPVSESGLAKTRQQIEAINDEIASNLKNAPPDAKVDPKAIASRVNGLFGEFNSVTPQESHDAIRLARNEYLAKHAGLPEPGGVQDLTRKALPAADVRVPVDLSGFDESVASRGGIALQNEGSIIKSTPVEPALPTYQQRAIPNQQIGPAIETVPESIRAGQPPQVQYAEQAKQLGPLAATIPSGVYEPKPPSTKVTATPTYSTQVTPEVIAGPTKGTVMMPIDRVQGEINRVDDLIHSASSDELPHLAEYRKRLYSALPDDVKRSEQFMGTPAPQPYHVYDAQLEKQATYKELQGQYNQRGSAWVETRKALARGLKEDIQGLFPEIQGQNATEGRLIDLEGAIENRLKIAGNREGLTFNPYHTLARIVEAPGIKSRLAILLNKGSSAVTVGEMSNRLRALKSGILAASFGPNSDQ